MSRSAQAKRVMNALKKIEKESKHRSINELRIIVALERAIARLEIHLSQYLIFKGGFVLFKTADTARFTRDVDALAVGLKRPRISEMVEQALKEDLGDGLWFGDLVVEDLPDQGPYGGYRFNCAFQIGEPPKGPKIKIKRLSRIHIDIGFGDPIIGKPDKQMMLSILIDGKPVSWSVYPLESIFSEKLEALFSRGSANSRAKDVYDMALIFPKCSGTKDILRAIQLTFAHRKTPIPESFERAARTFDLSIMRSAWPSVELTEFTPSFDETWSTFLECLRTLDSTRG